MSEPTPKSAIPGIGPAFLLIVVAALASAFAALWGVQTVGHHREAVLEARIDSLRAVLGATGGRSPSPSTRVVSPDTSIDVRGDLDELRRAGFADPLATLRKELARHPDLIPFPGEHGPLKFYDADAIRPLGGHWVFASFDDGLVDGVGIFEYEIANGHLVWKRVAAKMD